VFDGAGLSSSEIPVRLVYVPTASGVRLAWNVRIQELSGQHWWNASVDAGSGELLRADDWIDDASYKVYAIPSAGARSVGRRRASTTDACSVITNGAAVAGNIAIVDRGTCTFVIKVKNAQNAGRSR
jgi:PA domain